MCIGFQIYFPLHKQYRFRRLERHAILEQFNEPLRYPRLHKRQPLRDHPNNGDGARYGAPQAGLPLYAFDGDTYTGYSQKTDAGGNATFTLPQGSYRFRADKNGTQFWSSTQNHCTRSPDAPAPA